MLSVTKTSSRPSASASPSRSGPTRLMLGENSSGAKPPDSRPSCTEIVPSSCWPWTRSGRPSPFMSPASRVELQSAPDRAALRDGHDRLDDALHVHRLGEVVLVAGRHALLAVLGAGQGRDG